MKTRFAQIRGGHPVLAVGLLQAALVLAGAPAAIGDTFAHSPALSKFTQELRDVGGPAGIPVAATDGTRRWHDVTATHYTIDINQFTDTLHPDLPPTTLWGYNPTKGLGVVGTPTQRHLGGIIVAQRGKPVQLTFRNLLPNAHILPVDTTLMGADGAQNRTVTHLHGGFVPWISDGGAYAWWDPQGEKGPSFINNSVLRPGQHVPDNESEYYYPNTQSARMMWYHDHADGITRLNAYAGIATAYIIRDNFEADLVKHDGLPKYVEHGGRELPLVIQDKIFLPADDPTFPGSAKTAGSLWYPFVYDTNRWPLAAGLPLPAVSVVPETFGDTMLVNGTVYPKANVDPRRYRLRILNACNARFVNLQLYEASATNDVVPDFTKPGPDFIVIGTEGGFLARAARVPSAPLNTVTDLSGNRSVDPSNPGGSLLTAPAERWDVVVDFNGRSGKKYILCNDAPAPFPMGDAANDYPNAVNANGDSTVLMRFDINANRVAIPPDAPFLIPVKSLAGGVNSGIDAPLAGIDPTMAANQLTWLTATTSPLSIPQRRDVTVRQVTLSEITDNYGRLMQMLGNNVATSPGDFSRPSMDMMGAMPTGVPTETPKAGTTEVWQIVNLTGDTHPIHMHLVNAQLLSRQPFDYNTYTNTPVGQTATLILTGTPRGPLDTELGWKETFKANPGEVTTVIMKFALPKTPFVVPQSPRTGGYEYMWHCHILDHEEHDMMRPLVVQP